MPHADFVPDIGIVQGQIGDNELGEQQILKHVGVDRAAAAVGVGAVRHQPGRRNCRREEVFVDGIEVDRGAVRRLLLAKRHDDESAASGLSSACLPAGPNARTEASAVSELCPIGAALRLLLATWLGD